MSKFTPGPWENDNNARLIAMAPEMYETLTLVRNAIHEHGLLDVKKRYSLCVADAAISKVIAKIEEVCK